MNAPITARLTLTDLQGRIAQRLALALDGYRRQVTQNLAGQRRSQLLQRSLLLTVEQVYADTLYDLEALDPGSETTPVVNGRSALTPVVLAAFQGFSARLLEQVLSFNAASCALSNFPTEQQPDAEYRQDIQRDLAAAWRDFALATNRRLIQGPAH